MDTGTQDQVIFDMDQGYNQSYTQEQVSSFLATFNQYLPLVPTYRFWGYCDIVWKCL